MNSEFKFNNVIGDKDKKLIPLLYLKGKKISYLSEKYDLSEQFLRSMLSNEFNCVPVNLGFKNKTYYKDEMLYGTLNLKYNLEDLNQNELIAYIKYEQKNKAYYES